MAVLGYDATAEPIPGIYIDTDDEPKVFSAAAVIDNVAIGGGSLQSAVFAPHVRCVMVTADVDCWVTMGRNPTVSATTGTWLTAKVTYFFPVKPGRRLAVIQAAGAGNLNITQNGDG